MSDWQRVEQVFLEAVELPLENRASFLATRCAGDPDLYVEVISLLNADLDHGATIDSAVQSEALILFDEQVPIGAHFGMYVILRELGRGGMGAVYLAVREDQEYRKEVALKIVRRGMDTAEVLARFRYERQILANLEHPYIARLFDGGSTENGVPFFVMEYIEGKPVDVFCRENLPDYKARCQLFLRVLEAVAYAHSRLVIHRDLKPPNILVKEDGSPKLLDFGIAKLLSGNPDGSRTQASSMRPYTPEYASPEQVLGLPITTSTDIYSLGAILYELLTGKSAQPIAVQTPGEIERIVCRTEIARPSLQARGLPSDLDNIILMAMRKEPERRYQSALQFGDDIRNHLEGRPVMARQNSVRYRCTKFLLRNRLRVAIASIVTASLIGALGMSLVQAHRAELARTAAEAARAIAARETLLAQGSALAESQQRTVAEQQGSLAEQQKTLAQRQTQIANDQRDDANHQRAIANERVKEILDLANRTLFDIHDAIAPLPGSVDARRTLVKTTLEYLENLQKQAEMDDQMRGTLSAAYFKVAMMQGDTQGASLQQFDLAESNLLKGQALLLPAYQHDPQNPKLMLQLVRVRNSLADLMSRSGRQKEAIKINLDLLPIAHRLFLLRACSLECRTEQAVVEISLTTQWMNVDAREALAHADSGIGLTRDLLLEYPADQMLKQRLGSLMAGGAAAYRNLGQLTHAASYYADSIQIREELLRDDPHNSGTRRNLMIAYGNYATMLGIPRFANLDQPDRARIYAGKAVAIAREMVAADANDVTARHDLGMSLGRLGMIDPAAGGDSQSLASLEEAITLIEPIARANPKSSEIAGQVAMIVEYAGTRQQALARSADALTSYRKSMSILQPFVDVHDGTVTAEYVTDEEHIAVLEASLGHNAEALEEANQAIGHAQRAGDHNMHTDSQTAVLGKAWAMMAITQSKLGMVQDARESASDAIRFWSTITRPGILLTYRKLMAETQLIADLPAPH